MKYEDFPESKEMTHDEMMDLIKRLITENKQQASLIEEQRKEIERYRGIFERMVKGDVWMTFDDDPIEAFKELAKHALKEPLNL